MATAIKHAVMVAGGDLGSAAKGSAIDLEVAGSSPLAAVFPFPPLTLPCVVLQPVFYLPNNVV